MHPSSAAAIPEALQDIAARVSDTIDRTLAAEEARWAELDPALSEPLAALRRLVDAGGKRLRPAFCYWAFVGCGGEPGDAAAVTAGAALELLHTFALIHDDVMDDSGVRHGRPTLHVDFARAHRDAGWRGNAERYGTAVAVLVGDLAFVYADRLMRRAPVEALAVWDELRLEVNVGQYLDVAGSARRSANPALARRICQYKSGKYTVERPLHLGAALLGHDPAGPVGAALSSYGMPLGEAFQLRDDLLGVFGDPAATGKPVGEDLREGKPTLLLALARASATGPAAALLDERLGQPDLRDDEVAALQDIFDATGARTQVESVVEKLVDQALTAADQLPLDAASVRALTELALFVAGRDH